MFKTAVHVSIDIETGNLSPDQVEFETQFLKHHPSTKDPDKQAAQVEKKASFLLDRGALTNSAPILSVALNWGGTPAVLHNFPYDGKLSEYGLLAYKFNSESDMLEGFREFMDNICSEETVIVVAGEHFDLPKLRLAMARNRIKIPESISPGSPNKIYDVLYVGGKYFLLGNKRHHDLGLDELCLRLGVKTGGKVISGSEVPNMADAGQYEEILVYNGLDAIKNTECWKVMTGNY